MALCYIDIGLNCSVHQRWNWVMGSPGQQFGSWLGHESKPRILVQCCEKL